MDWVSGDGGRLGMVGACSMYERVLFRSHVTCVVNRIRAERR